MKTTIILLSILAATATWWWNTRARQSAGKPSFGHQFQNILKCLAAGAVVYFALMACAVVYLMITTS
ncbi:hypothetical protein CR155_05940 [Pollutimonas nitritireducens]|uniref:Uncharacterized protein n=1 Tax=Pollutimonas nitritireducens TaxID=2045209 RepID=A0A2N4UIZ8_9BURK|nr:hypothetical protein [Pollutimonas nitritireducens]PLC54991.1 hypothetical protein CR155_05940 [Pollutimonas nitritireducens]